MGRYWDSNCELDLLFQIAKAWHLHLYYMPAEQLQGNFDSTSQSVLTIQAKYGIGSASIPTAGIPFLLHSTIVVPVPQKGSSTKL